MTYLGENSDVLNNVCPKTRKRIISELLTPSPHEKDEDSPAHKIMRSVEWNQDEYNENKENEDKRIPWRLSPTPRLSIEVMTGKSFPRHDFECDKCGWPLNHERVCTYCGLISQTPILDHRSPRIKDLDGEYNVTADPYFGLMITRHDYGLGSTFDVVEEKDEEKNWLYKRMKELHEKPENESLRNTMILIKRAVRKLNLPRPVRERIAYLYRKIKDQGLTARRDVRTVIGALVMITTREIGVPITGDEVLDVLRELFTVREMGRHYDTGEGLKVTRRNLKETEKYIENKMDLEVPAARVEQYIDRYATKLGLDREGMSRAHRICSMVDETKIGGNPEHIAAGITYVANRGKVTQKEVADVFSMSRCYVSKIGNEIKNSLIDSVAGARSISGIVGK